MANVTRYNAKDCVITVDGVYLTGLGETMVSGEKDEDNASAAVGAQGDVVINETNNELGTITITVQATCPQRKHLIKLAKTKAIFPIWVNNKSLGSKFGGTKAFFKKTPAFEEGAEAADLEFEAQVCDYCVE